MSKQKNGMKSVKEEKMKLNTNQSKQQFTNLLKSSKLQLKVLDIKNKLKVQAVKHKWFQMTENSSMDTHSTLEAKPSQLRSLNRATNIFSGVIIAGLSVGLLYMARPVVTAETFDVKMEESIKAAFAYQGSDINITNGNVAYHIPRQFQYQWSIGVNDVIKYKDNEVIMHYTNQYNTPETFELLREENKGAGEEVFYQQFYTDTQKGFIQLVKLPEKYLLTVLVNGAKLSAIIDYKEAPYLAYNMLILGRTVEGYETVPVSQVEETDVEQEVEASIESEPAESMSRSVPEVVTSQEVDSNSNEEMPELVDEINEKNDDESMTETEQVLQFDFSSNKRNEALSMDGE